MVRIKSVNALIAQKRCKLLAVAAIAAVGGLNAGVANAALSAMGPIIPLQPVTSLGGAGNPGLSSNIVTPGDTFSIAIVGFNGTTSTASGAYLTSPSTFDPTFGTTTTYVGDALGGQTLTITSVETVGVATTSDTITMSVPTNFAPTGTKIGTRYIAAIDLDIGGYNAYTIPGGTTYDTLDYSTPPTAPVATGSINYSGGVFALTPQATAENGGLSYEAAEGVSSGTGATQASSVEGLNVNVISFTLTYPTVATPEPASMSLLGVAGAALMGRKRRRTV